MYLTHFRNGVFKQRIVVDMYDFFAYSVIGNLHNLVDMSLYKIRHRVTNIFFVER